MRIELSKRITPLGYEYYAKLIELEFQTYLWNSFIFSVGKNKGWFTATIWIFYFSYINYEWNGKKN